MKGLVGSQPRQLESGEVFGSQRQLKDEKLFFLLLLPLPASEAGRYYQPDRFSKGKKSNYGKKKCGFTKVNIQLLFVIIIW